MSVQRKIIELAQEIQDTEEFKKFQSAKEQLEQREAAKHMLSDFSRFQRELMEKEERGEEITPEEEAQMAERFQILMMNPYVRSFVQAQYQVMELLIQVQEGLVNHLGLVEKPSEEAPEEKETKQDSKVIPLKKPKLWTPND